MPELIDIASTIIEFVPTALVGLVIGLFAQRVIRLGQKEQAESQQAVNRLAETQQVLDSQEVTIKRLVDELERERDWRIESDERSRVLFNLVVKSVNATAEQVAGLPEPLPTDRE